MILGMFPSNIGFGKWDFRRVRNGTLHSFDLLGKVMGRMLDFFEERGKADI